MITLYKVDCSPLLIPEEWQSVLPLLDEERRRRVERLQQPEKKAQCAAAGMLLTHMFGSNGTPPILSHGSRGKPYLAGRSDLFFSLSHTGRWVFCAISDQEIGVDAQLATPYRLHVAERCFTPQEREWLAEDPDGRFTRLWTMKEAYLKYTGFGLVLPMSSFAVPLPPRDGWDNDNHCCWNLTTAHDENNTVNVSLCGASHEPLPSMHTLDVRHLKSLPE